MIIFFQLIILTKKIRPSFHSQNYFFLLPLETVCPWLGAGLGAGAVGFGTGFGGGVFFTAGLLFVIYLNKNY